MCTFDHSLWHTAKSLPSCQSSFWTPSSSEATIHRKLGTRGHHGRSEAIIYKISQTGPGGTHWLDVAQSSASKRRKARWSLLGRCGKASAHGTLVRTRKACENQAALASRHTTGLPDDRSVTNTNSSNAAHSLRHGLVASPMLMRLQIYVDRAAQSTRETLPSSPPVRPLRQLRVRWADVAAVISVPRKTILKWSTTTTWRRAARSPAVVAVHSRRPVPPLLGI